MHRAPMPRVVVIVQGEVFRSGACRGPTCMSRTLGSAQGTRVTSGPTNEQIQAFRSIQELAIDHLGALGWNVTTCVDVVSASRQRAELVQSHWASSVAGCGLQVRPQVAATQLEARIEVLDRAEQHLGSLAGCAALLMRADLVLKQPLQLPTPRDEEQEAAGGAIRFPFAMRGTMTGRTQTLLGNPRMADCFVWVPAAQLAHFRGVLAEHRSEAHAHDFVDWWRASVPRAPLPRLLVRGLFDADPSKGWNPLFTFANRHCRMPHGLCLQPEERGRTQRRQEGGLNERKPQELPLVTGAIQRRATPPPRLVAAFARDDSARYFSVVDFGRGSASDGRTRAGEVWLIARRGVWPSAAPAETAVVWPGCTATLARLTQRGGGDGEHCAPFHQHALGTRYDARSWEPPAVPLSVPHHVAHNLAVTVDLRRGALLMAGGQYRARPLKLLQGQLVSEASPGVLAYSASPAWRPEATNGSMPSPRLLLRGDHPGCVERRALFEGRCEFDGKLSLAATADGRLHLYARANLNVQAGGRHVQVASAASPDSTFGPFRTIRIEGYTPQSGARAGGPDIYYAAVKPNPADGDRSLVGLFPVRTSHAAFIGLAVSVCRFRFHHLRVSWARPYRVPLRVAAVRRGALFASTASCGLRALCDARAWHGPPSRWPHRAWRQRAFLRAPKRAGAETAAELNASRGAGAAVGDRDALTATCVAQGVHCELGSPKRDVPQLRCSRGRRLAPTERPLRRDKGDFGPKVGLCLVPFQLPTSALKYYPLRLNGKAVAGFSLRAFRPGFLDLNISVFSVQFSMQFVSTHFHLT